jgi:mono/diheme cytochrome c family protein
MTKRLLVPALLGAMFASYAVVRAQSPSKSVWDGVYTEAQAAKGKELYTTHCASCHSDSMEGGEMAPALAGGAFGSNWAGLTAGDLFERIRTTMPLNTPGKLSREINANILAYIFKFNNFPAGSAELSGRTEYLKEIRIDASKK